ncbi:low specificity L-threonine aldolase [Xinfangfangia sp. CPCC 101601]|uniref:L-threonine aldolase n=1 Tax=Pseudogemmobacter lacusdianii TaxID=3069608 RepID=A0ABU0W066_9RHOB|nr:low specificity L-threonine aldolase [Xinfangfangia sp. CPCC 101601]MDQ2067386.1 low specificity L-threonine aldolase [Xinfangfangia sp. CPCC 101601]
MFFASDNSSGAAPEIMAAVLRANDGSQRSYGGDDLMARVTAQVRALFEAPEAAVYLVATGTAANALSIALTCPPWGAVFCHQKAHVAEDECNAPEFFAGGAKLLLVDGAEGKIDPAALQVQLDRIGAGGVHSLQSGMMTLTNITEAGTLYTPAEIAALTALAKAKGLPCHLDGARFANALVASGATPAEMTWKAGIDILSFGGTKNGCLGVEAVVIFDPAKAFEFEIRRKRAGHLFSKHRFLSAQFDAYLEDGLWLRLAGQANAMGQRLASGLFSGNDAVSVHPVPANLMFADWSRGTSVRLQAKGAQFYSRAGAEGRERARLVTSWATSAEEVDAFLSAYAAQL